MCLDSTLRFVVVRGGESKASIPPPTYMYESDSIAFIETLP